MLTKKYIYSVFGYFFVTMLVAYPWHLIFFHEKYVEMGAITRAEAIVPFGMIAVLIQGIVFSYFYPLFYKYIGGGQPIVRGIQFSLFMGLNVWTVMVFATVAKFQIEPVLDFIIYGTVFQILQFLCVGAVIGSIYGKVLRSEQ